MFTAFTSSVATMAQIIVTVIAFGAMVMYLVFNVFFTTMLA